ncbi:MAG: DUF805 domain-containing protein [Candidatus Accumulibacter sp.]|uniref:DUF805 domain-containing protein n=1 Tax=Accumulibacter sp. TaxID=2053492 RepID=UPI002879E2F5|nr:DUF805 domain-containing protein [Accumulibacter sp.]MDS4012838.1 DUF805 domain-containing protein [Accumulibacter sp.]
MRFFVRAFQKFADFKGRASRGEYWYFLLFSILIIVLLTVLDVMLGIWNEESGLGVLGAIWGLIILVPSLSVGARRLHDTNRSGWWQLINFVPWVGPIVLLVLLALEGTDGDNRFGPPPAVA